MSTRSLFAANLSNLAKASDLHCQHAMVNFIRRRFARSRRRRKIGRAYDMALEISRILPKDLRVLDAGCGNGYIAHHLSSLLKTSVTGIDVLPCPDAQIEYATYDGRRFPFRDQSFDCVLFCYVLHHAHNARLLLDEVTRVLDASGTVVIYEDIPGNWLDRGACWTHNFQWKKRSGLCTFLLTDEWRQLFLSCGFEIVSEKKLSRWRNMAHPVTRRLYVLRLADQSLKTDVNTAQFAIPSYVSEELAAGA